MDTLAIRIVTLEPMRAASAYGFNNPNLSPNNPNYGYEFWLKVGPETQPEGDIRITEFMGGTYAVARCEAQGDPGRNIPAAWQKLAQS